MPSRKQHGAEKKKFQTPLVIAQPDDKPVQNDVQFLNITQENILSKLEERESKISEIAQNTDRISKAFKSLEKEVNVALHNVYQWLVSNKLTLNLQKQQIL